MARIAWVVVPDIPRHVVQRAVRKEHVSEVVPYQNLSDLNGIEGSSLTQVVSHGGGSITGKADFKRASVVW